MLSERFMERYADVLLWGMTTARTGSFDKGDIVLLRYDLAAVRLAEIINRKLLEKGFHVVHRLSATSVMEKDFFTISGDAQLEFQAPGDRELYSRLNGSIFLHAPESITHLGDVDPMRIAKTTIARKYLRDILDKREENGEFGWTLCMYPTEVLAKHANMSIEEYSDEIAKACFLDSDDPVGQWKDVFERAIDVKKWLNSMEVKSYRMESKNMDVEIVPGEKRKWIGISGHNIPSFEIFLSPDCRGTKGVYFADKPSYRSGNLVSGVRLEFEGGRVRSATAEEGQEFLRKQVAMDAGSSMLGEFSLTDRRFSKIGHFMANTLFDENFGGEFGNSHVALGASYSDTYDGDPATLTPEKKKELGFNDSALHWDLVNTEEKRVVAELVTGEKVTVYEDGEFKY